MRSLKAAVGPTTPESGLKSPPPASTCAAADVAGLNGASRNIYSGDKNSFMPRLGITYRLGNKTVVRAGFRNVLQALGVRRGDSRSA